MTLSDKVRRFVFHEYIEPARRRGNKTVTVRAGDVHSQMGLTQRLPLVCSALGTLLFQERYNVGLVRREGPANGSNSYFTYQV